MAEVYLAIARGPLGVRKLVVVKCMRPGTDLDGSMLEMFLAEGRLAALLSHANVVHTYEVGQSDDGPYIVMEYLHGQPLSAIARVAKPLAPRLAARIAADALSGLHYAHELRDLDGTPLSIVHRDLSPPNIFVTHDGVVKLVDFGIAKTALPTRALTEAGLVKGKLSYMAPEQAASEDLDRRADIYAMGVVLWELLTGRRLVEDPSPAAAVRHALHGTAPLVSSVRSEIDPALDWIVERALRRDPEARHATALEMREALDEFLARGPATGPTELGRLMAEHFSTQREQRERQIQSWVSKFAPEQPSSRESVAPPAAQHENEPVVEQMSKPSEATPRSARALGLRSRRRLVRGVLVAGALSVGLLVFAFRTGQGRSTDRARAAEPAVAGATVMGRAPDSKPDRPDVVPSGGLGSVPKTEASSERRPSGPDPDPGVPGAGKASRSPSRVAHSMDDVFSRSPGAPSPAGAPAATAALDEPARAAQQKPKKNPKLERNPYMHSK
jgi:serine/threonine protein kinase